MENIGKLLLRVMLGGMLLLHGIHKIIHGVAPIKQMLVAHHLPEVLAYGVYVGEVLAALFVLIGWKSRFWASVIVVNMSVAIYLTQWQGLSRLGAHGGWAVELPMFYLGTAMVVMLLGSGKYAILRD